MDYDTIIVGSGAGGSAIAYQLAQSGIRTLLIERGPTLPHDGSTLDVEKVVGQGRFRFPEMWKDIAGRAFQPSEYANLGGKTKWYGAALLRQSPHEFEADAAHQCPAWPITYEELRPFYDQAEELLQLKRFPTEPDLVQIVAALKRRDPRWIAEALPVGLSEKILANPFEAHHFDGFANPNGLKSDAEVSFLRRVEDPSSLTVQTDCAVTALMPSAADPAKVAGIRCQNGDEITARRIVLACGALHSPRVLTRYLVSTGLAERLPSADLVGRNYKCHMNTALIVFAERVFTDELRKTTILFNEQFPHSTVQNLGWLDGELMSYELPRVTPRWVSDMAGSRAYGFWITTEDGSHPDNRVLPATDGDDFPRLDYSRDRIAVADQEHRQLIRVLQQQLLRSGYAGFVKRMPIENTAHACGTLAAGEDPARSVVDRDGKVHGMANLYVADGSAMSRSGRVNPALTIYAWGLRLGHHLQTLSS